MNDQDRHYNYLCLENEALKRQVAALQIRKVYQAESMRIESLLEICISNFDDRDGSVQRTLDIIESCCAVLESRFGGNVEYGVDGCLYSNANFDRIANVDIERLFFETLKELVEEQNYLTQLRERSLKDE